MNIINLKKDLIDKGNNFDFGKTSLDYARYRDIYPKSLYDKLVLFGIGKESQSILDMGTGTGVIPRNMQYTQAMFTGIDISKEQIEQAIKLSDGMNIKYKVCSCENTGFDNDTFDVILACQCFHYFNLDTFVPELIRLLKPSGRFCKIFMDWKPFEDDIVKEMETLVLKYNPNWTGYGFKQYIYNFPDWAKDKFELETVHSYDEYLSFTKDSWIGRIRTCRGIGASLSPEKIKQFDNEYKILLQNYNTLSIKHQIHIEIYRLNNF